MGSQREDPRSPIAFTHVSSVPSEIKQSVLLLPSAVNMPHYGFPPGTKGNSLCLQEKGLSLTALHCSTPSGPKRIIIAYSDSVVDAIEKTTSGCLLYKA